MIGYVYVISNTINNKVYIGITKNILRRWSAHKLASKSGKSKIYSAMRKHGSENFKIDPFITVLDYDNYCANLEIETIELFDSYKNGYNSTFGGEIGFLDNPRNRVSYTGEKFGKMTVLYDLPDAISTVGYMRMVKCLCDCGKEKSVALSKLKNGHTESCGCIRFGITNHKYVNVIGEVFGDLTIIDDVFPSLTLGRSVKCMCTCGKVKVIALNALKSGNTKSCGGGSTCVVDGIKYKSLSEAARVLGYKSASGLSKMLAKFEDRGFVFHEKRPIANANEHRKKPIMCVETQQTFDSCTQASEYMKLNGYPKASPSKISACSNGSRKSAYKFHWKFVEKY